MYDTTLDFDSHGEALQYLADNGFRRLPVKGLVRRWVANEVDDDGAKLLTFASSTQGSTRVNLTSRRT
jgi:hypothetical protein